jgi:hypothetical protein
MVSERVAKRIEAVLDQLAVDSATDDGRRGHRDVELLCSGPGVGES